MSHTCHESHTHFLDASKLFFGNPPKKSAALSKEDLRKKYPKYVKMLSMGLPEGPVRQSMMKDSISSDEIEVYHTMHNYLVSFLYLFISLNTQIFFGNEKDGQKRVDIDATPPKPLLSPAAQKFVDSLPTPSSSVKMTAFHWTKIPHNQVDRSMWPDLLAKTSFKSTIDSKALEELFGSREANPTTTNSSNGANSMRSFVYLTSS
jgi:hypothetical protein